MKPRGGEGQNGRLKCPIGFLVNNKTVILLGLAGHQIIITISALRASLYANLCVPTRVYDVEGGAIFSKNSTFVFFDGYTWTPRLRSPFLIMAPVMRLT